MNEPNTHLDDTDFQAFLEDELALAERGSVADHLAGCVECAAELETWRVLFADLSAMPHLEPAPALRARIGAQLVAPAPRRWSSRIADALTPGWIRRRMVHLRPRAVQDLLDGSLSTARAEEAYAHARKCPPCEEALESWQLVYGAVGSLGRMSPSPGFADAVMARCAKVRVRAPVRSPARSAAVDWFRHAIRAAAPKTRFGWSVATAFGIGPLIGLALLVAAVVRSPVVRLTDLVTFAFWQIGEFARLTFATGVQRVLDFGAYLELGGIASTLASAPALTAFGVVAVWTAIGGSGWILYRHLVTPYLSAHRHAQSSR